MSDGPEPAARSEWAEVLHAASRPTSPPASDDLVRRALLLGSDVTSRLVGCSLTVAGASGWSTPQASNASALELDLAQYEAGTGPCVVAAGTGGAVDLSDIDADPRFTAFAHTAVRAGVRSSLSLPLPGAPSPTALNLYAGGTAAFASQRSHRVAGLLARAVAALLAPARPDDGAADEATAHAHGAVVRDGVAVLARAHDASWAHAYRGLAVRSGRETRPILLLAREVLDSSGAAGGSS